MFVVSEHTLLQIWGTAHRPWNQLCADPSKLMRLSNFTNLQKAGTAASRAGASHTLPQTPQQGALGGQQQFLSYSVSCQLAEFRGCPSRLVSSRHLEQKGLLGHQADHLHLGFFLGCGMGAEHHLGPPWEAEVRQAELGGLSSQVEDDQEAGAGAWPEESHQVLGVAGQGQQGEVGVV